MGNGNSQAPSYFDHKSMINEQNFTTEWYEHNIPVWGKLVAVTEDDVLADNRQIIDKDWDGAPVDQYTVNRLLKLNINDIAQDSSQLETRIETFVDKYDNLKDRYDVLINKFSELHRVAKTGKYSDLEGTPTLHTIALTGSYNDLFDKPEVQSMSGYATESQIANIIASINGMLSRIAALEGQSNQGGGGSNDNDNQETQSQFVPKTADSLHSLNVLYKSYNTQYLNERLLSFEVLLFENVEPLITTLRGATTLPDDVMLTAVLKEGNTTVSTSVGTVDQSNQSKVQFPFSSGGPFDPGKDYSEIGKGLYHVVVADNKGHEWDFPVVFDLEYKGFASRMIKEDYIEDGTVDPYFYVEFGWVRTGTTGPFLVHDDLTRDPQLQNGLQIDSTCYAVNHLATGHKATIEDYSIEYENGVVPRFKVNIPSVVLPFNDVTDVDINVIPTSKTESNPGKYAATFNLTNAAINSIMFSDEHTAPLGLVYYLNSGEDIPSAEGGKWNEQEFTIGSSVTVVNWGRFFKKDGSAAGQYLTDVIVGRYPNDDIHSRDNMMLTYIDASSTLYIQDLTTGFSKEFELEDAKIPVFSDTLTHIYGQSMAHIPFTIMEGDENITSTIDPSNLTVTGYPSGGYTGSGASYVVIPGTSTNVLELRGFDTSIFGPSDSSLSIKISGRNVSGLIESDPFVLTKAAVEHIFNNNPIEDEVYNIHNGDNTSSKEMIVYNFAQIDQDVLDALTSIKETYNRDVRQPSAYIQNIIDGNNQDIDANTAISIHYSIPSGMMQIIIDDTTTNYSLSNLKYTGRFLGDGVFRYDETDGCTLMAPFNWGWYIADQYGEVPQSTGSYPVTIVEKDLSLTEESFHSVRGATITESLSDQGTFYITYRLGADRIGNAGPIKNMTDMLNLFGDNDSLTYSVYVPSGGSPLSEGYIQSVRNSAKFVLTKAAVQRIAELDPQQGNKFNVQSGEVTAIKQGRPTGTVPPLGS